MKTRLQELRKAAGFKSANAFADHMEIKRGTYTDYEQGRIGLSLEQAWIFADVFDCSLDELAGRERPAIEYKDPRQTQLNADYEYLDDHGKIAAANAVRGIAAGVAREKTTAKGPDADNVRTA